MSDFSYFYEILSNELKNIQNEFSYKKSKIYNMDTELILSKKEILGIIEVNLNNNKDTISNLQIYNFFLQKQKNVIEKAEKLIEIFCEINFLIKKIETTDEYKRKIDELLATTKEYVSLGIVSNYDLSISEIFVNNFNLELENTITFLEKEKHKITKLLNIERSELNTKIFEIPNNGMILKENPLSKENLNRIKYEILKNEKEIIILKDKYEPKIKLTDTIIFNNELNKFSNKFNISFKTKIPIKKNFSFNMKTNLYNQIEEKNSEENINIPEKIKEIDYFKYAKYSFDQYTKSLITAQDVYAVYKSNYDLIINNLIKEKHNNINFLKKKYFF